MTVKDNQDTTVRILIGTKIKIVAQSTNYQDSYALCQVYYTVDNGALNNLYAIRPNNTVMASGEERRELLFTLVSLFDNETMP